MARPAPHPAPLAGVGPHGEPEVHVCRGCLDQAAAYPGQMPRGWRRELGGPAEWCPRCWRSGGRAAVQPDVKEIR